MISMLRCPQKGQVSVDSIFISSMFTLHASFGDGMNPRASTSIYYMGRSSCDQKTVAWARAGISAAETITRHGGNHEHFTSSPVPHYRNLRRHHCFRGSCTDRARARLRVSFGRQSGQQTGGTISRSTQWSAKLQSLRKFSGTVRLRHRQWGRGTQRLVQTL